MAALGIAVAVGTLLTAVSSAERSRAGTVEEIRKMGADVLVLDAAASRNVAGRSRTGTIVTSLTSADAREVAIRIPGIDVVAAEYRATLPMKVGDLARQVTVSGDDPGYAELRAAPVARGRFFSSVDDAGAQRVAVLGARLAVDLFTATDPIGAVVRLGGVPFTVIGVLPERGTGVDAFDEDQVVFVPLRTARRRLFNVDYVQRIFLRLSAGADADEVGRAIHALIAIRHPRRGGDSVDFRVQDQRRLVEMREGAAARLRAFQVSVAAVMLLAGGGGIFALQVLAVRERRAEIGVRRTLGATRWDIFSQFVTEAWTVSAVGVGAGVFGGWLGTTATEAPLGLPFAACAACAALGVCMVAAALPALRAARLPPAVALRLR